MFDISLPLEQVKATQGLSHAHLSPSDCLASRPLLFANGAYQVETIQDNSGSAKHLDGQNDAAIPEIGAKVQCLCDADP